MSVGESWIIIPCRSSFVENRKMFLFIKHTCLIIIFLKVSFRKLTNPQLILQQLVHSYDSRVITPLTKDHFPLFIQLERPSLFQRGKSVWRLNKSIPQLSASFSYAENAQTELIHSPSKQLETLARALFVKNLHSLSWRKLVLTISECLKSRKEKSAHISVGGVCRV